MAPLDTKKHKSRGASIVDLLIGTVLVGILVASGFKLFSETTTSADHNETSQVLEHLTQIGKFMAFNLNRGGGWLSDSDRTKGIQVCNLNASGSSSSCSTFQTSTTTPCLVIPQVRNPSTIPSMHVQGFRLFNKVLQKKLIDNTDWTGTSVSEFCTNNTGWEDMHSSDDFTMNSLKLCSYDASTMDKALQDYNANCPTVLVNDTGNKTGHWFASFTVTPSGPNQTAFDKHLIIRLFNKPNVGSI